MLFRNTVAQSARLVTAQLLSVIVAPLLISRLGLEAFGVWAVTGAFANYASLLDLGITRSLSRFVALYDARGDRLAVRRVVAVGFMAVTMLGILVLGAALLAAPLVNDALGTPITTPDMRIVLTSSGVLLVLSLYGMVCSGYALGLRRMVPPNVAGIFGSLCNFGASVAVLLADPHLTSYALANAAAGVPALIAQVVAMYYVGGRRVVARPTWPLFREITAFSLKSQLSSISDLVNIQTDKLIIAVAVGIRASAAYEIGARVALAVRELALLTTSAMIPTATAAIVEGGTRAVGVFYSKYMRLVMGISVGVFAVAALSAPYVLTAWIGSTPHEAGTILVGLSLAYLAWMTTGVPSTLSLGAGLAGMVASNSILVAVLNLLLTAALAPVFGTVGVLTGTVVAMIVMAGVFLVRFHRAFGIPRAAFIDGVRGPLTLGLSLGLPAAALVIFVLPVPEERPGALLLLALVAGGFGLAYWIGATAMDLLPEKLHCPGVRPRGRAAVAAPPT